GAPVHAREPEVGDDDVEGEIGEARERLFAARGLLHHEAVIRESLGDGLAQCGLVVHEQQMFRGVSHLVARRYFDTQAIGGQPQSPPAAGPKPYRAAESTPITGSRTAGGESPGSDDD